MKNILLTGGMWLLTGMTVFASPEAGHHPHLRNYTSPTYQTEQQFEIDFPGATNVTWYTKDMEEASFTFNGQSIRAFYDNDDKLIGTVTDASYSDLPATAVKQIEKYYKGYTPQRVILFDDNEYNDSPMSLYGSVFDDEDNYFVEMQHAGETIILQVNMRGDVGFFKEMK